MNSRGDISAGLFILVEIVLSLLVLVVIGAVILEMSSGATFFQSFFAKDNAHLVEALQTVPNGELHFGYLWSTTAYSISFYNNNGTVTVQSIGGSIENPTKTNQKTKAFGTSQNTPVDTVSFVPKYYQLIRTTIPSSSISILRDFSSLKCPSSQIPLTGMTGTASEDGFSDVAQPTIDDVMGAVRVNRLGDFSTNSGFTIHLHLEKSSASSVTIYYRSNDDQVLRLACLLAQATSTAGKNTIYTPNIPDYMSQYSSQIIVCAQLPSNSDVSVLDDQLKKGITQYWGEQSG